MGETSLSDLDPEQLRKLLSIAEEPEAHDSGEEPASSCPSHIIDMPPQQLGSWIDRYKLVEYLGEGGMAIVYLAEQEYPVQRTVALKLIKPGMDSKRVIARFEAERQALALLNHLNIAQIYDAGTTEAGRPYFVMEYVKGLSIIEHCDHHKLTIDDRLKLFMQLCHAVHYAHQKGIIHRDIKPSNILVSIQNEQSVPKIIDFGVAKAISQPLTERTLYTEQGQLFGTPEYMSPEQADMANEDIDTRSDIYSLGVLLYVLLTGVLPFDSATFRGGGIEHIRQVIRETDPKTPSTRLSSLGEQAKEIAETRRMEVTALAKCLHKELEWIPLKAIRKERAERYRSASELADDIDNYLKGAPLIAGPPGTVYRFKKFMRRHKALVTGTAMIIAVLVGGIIVSTHLAIKAERARTEAQAVSDFLTGSVIELIDPYKVASEEITRRFLLDSISENLEQDFAGPPFAEAQIRFTLGYAYWSIGVYDLAESYIKPAIEVCRITWFRAPHYLGLDDDSWMDIPIQGRFREAEQLFTRHWIAPPGAG